MCTWKVLVEVQGNCKSDCFQHLVLPTSELALQQVLSLSPQKVRLQQCLQIKTQELGVHNKDESSRALGLLRHLKNLHVSEWGKREKLIHRQQNPPNFPCFTSFRPHFRDFFPQSFPKSYSPFHHIFTKTPLLTTSIFTKIHRISHYTQTANQQTFVHVLFLGIF